jgi:hypothetical protein
LKQECIMTFRREFLLTVAASAMLTATAQAQSTEGTDPTAALPCTIDSIFAKYLDAAKVEADALHNQKTQELVDPENRADRAKNRVEKSDNFTIEGGSAQHRLAFDVPQIRMHRVSFSFPETFMGNQTIQIPDGAKQCMVPIPFGKTLVPCGVHYRNAVVSVPQWRTNTVILDLPDAVKWQRVDVVYDTPTVTYRDNKHDLETAKGDIERIEREMGNGSTAISSRNDAAFFDEAGKAIDKVETSVLADFDKMSQEQLAPFALSRKSLESQHGDARAKAGSKIAEVDTAFAKVFATIDEAEEAARAQLDIEHQRVTQQFDSIRDGLKKGQLSCTRPGEGDR